MRYLKLKEQLLNEINMSPNSLRREARAIGARAGMEFEMIVKGAAESEEGDDYLEPDMDSNESINSINDAFHFYYDGNYNSRRDAQDLVDRMRNDYQDWLSDQASVRWDTDKDEVVYRWLRNNADEEDIGEILGKEFNEENEITKQDFKDASDKVVEDQISPWYEDAEQDFMDDFYNDTDLESEWLEDQGITTMWDVQDNYSITWPHYYNPDTSGGDVSVEDAADSFSRAIGRPVEASGNYHSRSVKRPSATELHYVVEPDGSLSADDDSDGGLEFVSPALPIDELLDDLKKVKAWADKHGNYTNDSTGLHINVSVPKWQGDLSKLDYVKLAILMGDEYVLQEFGRSGNSYAKSALKIVKDNIRQRPEDVARLLDTMKEHLNTSAAKLIHSGSTNKYTSVNTKDGYIEFRSPGGDWLNENFDKIESTLLRFVVAMDAAVDETKYKEEYAKKLYKLLAGDQKDTTNTMVYFAKYAAGELPQSALKSFIKQAQYERSQSKEPVGKKQWWRVDKEGRGAANGASVEVVATSKEEALEKAASEWNTRLSSLTSADAYPLRPYQEPQAQPAGGSRNAWSQTDIENRLGWGGQEADANYEIVDRRTNRSIFKFIANTDQDAFRKYTQILDVFGFPHDTEVYGYREIGGAEQSTGPTSRYEIYRISDGRTVERNGQPLYLNARSPEDAEERARQIIMAANLGAPQLFDVRSVLQAPVQGSTQDRQQQRAQGGFTGAWKVLDGLGREVYRFSGVGNSQSDANRVAADWMRQHGQGGNFEVVPVMS